MELRKTKMRKKKKAHVDLLMGLQWKFLRLLWWIVRKTKIKCLKKIKILDRKEPFKIALCVSRGAKLYPLSILDMKKRFDVKKTQYFYVCTFHRLNLLYLHRYNYIHNWKLLKFYFCIAIGCVQFLKKNTLISSNL